MRWFVWWLRAVFCRHEWEYEEFAVPRYGYGYNSFRVSITCKKCGWHRAYWKF